MRVAVIQDGVLDQLWLERTIGFEEVPGRKTVRAGNAASRSIVGDIILGRVQRVLPAMQAAFVTVGLERAGFLAAREPGPALRFSATTPIRRRIASSASPILCAKAMRYWSKS